MTIDDQTNLRLVKQDMMIKWINTIFIALVLAFLVGASTVLWNDRERRAADQQRQAEMNVSVANTLNQITATLTSMDNANTRRDDRIERLERKVQPWKSESN